MKTMKYAILSGALVVLAAIAIIMTGCESEPSTDINSTGSYTSDTRDRIQEQDLVISPNTAAASFIGQKVSFKVDGGDDPFDWSLANGAGTIAVQEDTRYAVYTVAALSKNTIVVTDKDGRTGEITITRYTASLHLNSGSADVAPPGSAFTGIFDRTADFTVSGGTAPYTWSVLYAGSGAASPTTGDSTTYTANSNTNIVNILTVVDDEGNSATASIQHH